MEILGHHGDERYTCLIWTSAYWIESRIVYLLPLTSAGL
jgi:hypothetical protein